MVKAYDNGGATFDRYTIVMFGAVITMSPNALSPSGFNQYSHSLKRGEAYKPNNTEKEVELRTLPADVLVAIINRLSDYE